MKKIVSCTIATALATTNLTTMSVEAMNSTTKVDDSINVNEHINNSTEVIVEDTDKIENNNTTVESDNSSDNNLNENNSDNDSNYEESLTQDNGQTFEESNISSDDKLENNDIQDNSSVEVEQSNNINEIDGKEKESQGKSIISEEVKNYGKLEFDINFAMPIINTDSININLFKENQNIGQISDLSTEEGTLDNGVTYKIEKLNSKKQPLEDGENDIYFLHIIIEKLELGTYSAEIKSESYIDTTVDNI